MLEQGKGKQKEGNDEEVVSIEEKKEIKDEKKLK
jgi:hypothetical protein